VLGIVAVFPGKPWPRLRPNYQGQAWARPKHFFDSLGIFRRQRPITPLTASTNLDVCLAIKRECVPRYNVIPQDMPGLQFDPSLTTHRIPHNIAEKLGYPTPIASSNFERIINRAAKEGDLF